MKIKCENCDVNIDMNIDQAIEIMDIWYSEVTKNPGDIRMNDLARIQAMGMIVSELKTIRYGMNGTWSKKL